MPKVLISDRLSAAAVQLFQDRGIETDFRPGLPADELKAIVGEYDGLVVRSATKVTAEVLAAGSNLKVVGRAGIGIENVDVAAATAHGVVVMNTPYGNTITTAEHALALMFALARHIPQANASTHAGKWEKAHFVGVELTGKTLGIVGCGNIGAIVADRALGLKMKVVAFDPYLSADRARELGVEKADLDTVLDRADFISLHSPLNETTRNVINADTLARMKKGVRIVNCARGGLINEDDLRAALESGHVAGAALDVFNREPATDNPLFGMDNVICTPNLGASTAEAQENVALQVAEQMCNYLLTGAITNAVNMPAISAEDAPRLRPYIRLASQLGSFAGQLTDEPIRSVVIEFVGHVGTLNTDPLIHVLLDGLLKPSCEAVNMVNARKVADECGIRVLEARNTGEGDYHTLIRLRVTTDSRTRAVAGTLFGGGRARIVEVKGIPVEAELGHHVLFVTNRDQPGFIGALGSLLGRLGINIATFNLGRTEPGGDAILLTQVDQPLTDEVVAAVRALPQVVQAKALKF